MNPSAIFIHRPVLTIVVAILLMLFGIIGYSYLGVREFPSVDPPIVNVRTDYPGANADIIDAQVTEPLEAQISGISGVKTISSISSDGRSSISVEFDLGIDMDDAANDVRDKVSGAVRRLPPDIEPSVVSKADADASPIMAVLVQSQKRNLLELTQLGNDLFKERLQTIPGVSQVNIWGEKRYAMKLLIDPIMLAAYGLTPLDVRTALNRENLDLPSGIIEGRKTELSIRTMGRLTTEKEFNDLIIKESQTNPIRLKNVGRAMLLPENERTLLRGNGAIPMIGVAITPQPGTNYIDISDAFREKLKQIDKELPDDIVYNVGFDVTDNIRNAIQEVRDTILIAFSLVMLVIFLFLRRWRTTLIPVVTIPISLIASFFIMYVADFSINILTLLGIVLATGLVVDDAIVVLENIYKKIEDGIPSVQAAMDGSKEIFFAVISTTVTLVAVFMPVIFLQGLTGRLFREFGIVVAGAVIISTIISLTLTPMLCSKILTRKDKNSWFYRKSESFFKKLESKYESSLAAFMKIRWTAFIVVLISAFLIYWIGKDIQSELAPMEDKGRLLIRATAPEGTSFEMMDAFNVAVMDMLDTFPERRNLIGVSSPGFGSSVSVNSSFVRFNMWPADQRERSQDDMANIITKKLQNFPMARTFVLQEQTIGGGRFAGLPVAFVVQATNFDKLKQVLPEFMEKANGSSVFSVVDLDVKFNKPELKVNINRDRATALGVTVEDISQTLQLLYGGQRFGYFIFDGKQYQVIGQADRQFREKPLDLESVSVRNNRGELIQLSNLVSVEETSTPPQLFRYNRYVSATVSANPAPGYSLKEGIDEMYRIADEVLDESFSTDLSGVSKEFADSSNSLFFAFLLSLILVYLVLAAQFESFRDPLIIMFTVPLAVTGAIISLYLADMTLNIFSQIGIIVLVGIVTKNGILIVEFANQQKDKGLSIMDAVVKASSLRMRPILMTSFATVLGAVPIAFAFGSASTSRTPMGAVIIGGLLFSLILTLYIIPAIYSYFTSDNKRKDFDDIAKTH